MIMNDLNSVLLEGNLIRDPVLKDRRDKGIVVCYFPIASNRYYQNTDSAIEKEVSFFDVEVEDKRLIDICLAKGRKGKNLRIVGRLKQERWKDLHNQDFSKIIVIPDHIEFRETNPSTATKKELNNENN